MNAVTAIVAATGQPAKLHRIVISLQDPMSPLRPFLQTAPVLGARVYVDPAASVIGDV